MRKQITHTIQAILIILTTLPAHATRFQAWRRGPGSMPELLATSASREISITLPATITFIPGGTYQLWLVAINATGHSLPGPVQMWVAE